MSLKNFTNGPIKPYTVYEADIQRISSGTTPKRAFVLAEPCAAGYNGFPIRLLSDAVDDTGAVYIAMIPLPQRTHLDLYAFDVTLTKIADNQGRTTTLQPILNEAKYPAIVASPDGHDISYKVFKQMDPPDVEPVHSAYVETAGGRKQLLRYPGGKKYRVVDCVTNARVNILAEDLAEYFSSCR